MADIKTSVVMNPMLDPGFDQIIYGSQDGKPYLQFRIYLGLDSELAMQYCNKLHLLNIGAITSTNGEYLTISLRSSRKINFALDRFLPELDRKSSWFDFLLGTKKQLRENNQQLKEELILFKNECSRLKEENKEEEKPDLPKASIFMSSLIEGKKVTGDHRHNVVIVKKKNKDNSNQKEYFLKEHGPAGSLAEMETFNAACYHLLLGDRHPKVRSVLQEKGKRTGIISRRIPGLRSIGDYYLAKGKKRLTTEEVVASEMVKVWVAAYLEEEADLHLYNYGFNKDGICVKYDDDQATWPLTSKYAGYAPNQQYKKKTGKIHCPATDFQISQKEIASFPNLTTSNPPMWITEKRFLDYFESNLLENLPNDDKFVDDKYYLFLRRALIPDTTYEQIGKMIRSKKVRERFVARKCATTKKLKEELIKDEGFCNYLRKHPDAKSNFLEEFKVYKNAKLSIESDVVGQTFDELAAASKANFQNSQHQLSGNENRASHDDGISSAISGSSSLKMHTNITSPSKSKASFFSRHSWAKDIFITAGISIGILAVAAFCVVTFGIGTAAIPAVLGIGAAVGTYLGLSGTVATGVGLATLCTTFIAAFSVTCTSAGNIFGKPDQSSDVIKKNRSTRDINQHLSTVSSAASKEPDKIERPASCRSMNARSSKASTGSITLPSESSSRFYKKPGTFITEASVGVGTTNQRKSFIQPY